MSIICLESIDVLKVNDSVLSKSFSIFNTGSALMISHFGMLLPPPPPPEPFFAVFASGPVVSSHLTGVFVVESAATFCGDVEPMPASSGNSSLMSTSPSVPPNCFSKFSANDVAISFCESKACNSWSVTP